jgi:hypothetical protein
MIRSQPFLDALAKMRECRFEAFRPSPLASLSPPAPTTRPLLQTPTSPLPSRERDLGRVARKMDERARAQTVDAARWSARGGKPWRAASGKEALEGAGDDGSIPTARLGRQLHRHQQKWSSAASCRSSSKSKRQQQQQVAAAAPGSTRQHLQHLTDSEDPRGQPLHGEKAGRAPALRAPALRAGEGRRGAREGEEGGGGNLLPTGGPSRTST